jgi:16S rRNA (cytidine1402-2'-O)-methyltransferase
VAGQPVTLIAFEAPHRLRESLADIEAAFGDRPMAICRELTKLHEQTWRGAVSDARAYFADIEPRGEFTLVIGGATAEDERWDEQEVRTALADLLAHGISRSSAARRIAKASGWRKDDVYRLSLEMP